MVDALDAVSKETGKSAAQIALNWLLRRPGVTAPIVGARSLEQLDDNLGATGWSLTPDQVQHLDKASATRLPYPYEAHSRLT